MRLAYFHILDLLAYQFIAVFIEGSSVAIFGCGAIGLGVIQTSSVVGASRIIAVDTNPNKKSWAEKMGATDFINPKDLPEGKKIQDHLIEITDGGLDYTFDATGNVCTSVLDCSGKYLMAVTHRSM